MLNKPPRSGARTASFPGRRLAAAIGLTALCACFLAEPTAAAADRWEPFGRLTARLESRSYENAPGATPHDWLRLSAQAGIVWTPSENDRFVLRARTGPLSNHNGGFITLLSLDGRHTGPRTGYVDLWYWSHHQGNDTVRIGRFDNPIWTNTSFIWGFNADPAGLAWEHRYPDRGMTSSLSVGTAPDGGLGFHGKLITLQQQWRPETHSAWRLSMGAVVYQGGPGARHAADADLDYHVAVLSAQWTGERWPLQLGVDLFRNFKHYDLPAEDPRAAYADDRSGLGLEATLGRSRQRGDMRLRFRLAYLERMVMGRDFARNTFSVLGSTGAVGRSLQFNYTFSDRWSTGAEYTQVDLLDSDAVAKRARLELQYRFN